MNTLIRPKAVIFGEETGANQVLKDIIFKYGLKETAQLQSYHSIERVVEEGYWPVIFISHSIGTIDAISELDKLYRIPGFELFPYVVMGPTDSKKITQFGLSIGARAIIAKPIQPVQAQTALKTVLPLLQLDKVTVFAQQTVHKMIKGKIDEAKAGFEQLRKIEPFAFHAEIALLRIHIRKGEFAHADEIFKRLLKMESMKIRVLCEQADYYRSRTQIKEAINCYQSIYDMHPELNFRVWEHVLLLIDLDEIDQAAQMLHELAKDEVFKDMALDGLVRIMIFMGLSDYIPHLVKQSPQLTKTYAHYLKKAAPVAAPKPGE